MTSTYVGNGTYIDALTSPRTPLTGNSVNDLGVPTPIQQAINDGVISGNPINAYGALPDSKPSSSACATGSQGGPGQASGPGRALGADNNSALGSGIDPKLSESFNYAKAEWEAANPGMKVYAFSGVAERPQNPGSAHPNGRAMDVAIYGSDGKMMNNLNNGDTPAFRAYESFASSMGNGYRATQGANPSGDLRWGGNFGGTWYRDSMHFDVGEGVSPSQGNVYDGRANPNIPNNSDPSKGIKYDGPTDAASANAGGAGKAEGAPNDSALTSTGNTNNAVCANSDTPGCEPISAGTPGIASSILAGAGMGIPPQLTSALSGLSGAAGGVLSGGLMSAAQTALGSIPGLAQAGLPNTSTGITSSIFSGLQSMGGAKLPGLAGIIPTDLATSGTKGLLTTAIGDATSKIIQSNVAHLGGFPSVFSTALGSSAGSTNLQQALDGSISQIFGRAGNGILGKATTMPGFDLAAITAGRATTSEDEGIEAVGNVLDMHWKPNISNSVNLVQPFKDALPALISKPAVNGFSSLFKDYNSMITQGLGNLTDNLLALGVDLYNLGEVGDLVDLFNIGTARQLTRQIIEHGLGNATGLLSKLAAEGLTLATSQEEGSEPILVDNLGSINDDAIIAKVKTAFKINTTLNIQNLGDLLKADKVLPLSYAYNYFQNIQDMALTIALSGKGIGTLKTLGDLGYLMMNMETAESFTDLLDEYTLVRFDETDTLKTALPPSSMFNEDGPVVADFIGSAAGYIHNSTLPRMVEMHDAIFANALMTPYKDLITVLTATLNGTYSSGATVNPPDTAKYTIGTFSSLDAAVTDIMSKVELELDYIIATAPNTDREFWLDVLEYEALHRQSATFLVHEEAMRTAYGIQLGDPRRVTNYYGDGTTLNFALESAASGSVIVSVNGVYKVQNKDFTYSAANSRITFVVAPTAGQVVSIVYEVESVQASTVPGDTWQLASSIESHALQTGYGGAADYLNKIATNDRHGQRIKAIMMQARNKVRFESAGIACPGFNRVLNKDDSKDFNFVERTGMWSTSPARSAEIWLQRNEEVESIQDYVMNKLARNATVVKPDNDLLMANVTRRLIFLSNDQLVITDETAVIYSNSSNNGLFLASRPDMVFSYEKNVPTEGFVLGNYREILSEICRAEGFSDPNFNVPLSTATVDYLKKIGVDIPLLTSVFQRALLVSLSASLGISEEDAVDMFGVQSISKNILANISNHY